MVMASSTLGLLQWEAAGHAPSTVWYHDLGLVVILVLLAIVLWTLVLGFLRRHRYRAVDVLGEADLERVHAEVRDVESRTSGEILPVVVERSDRHPGAAFLAALCTLLLGSALGMRWLPWETPLLLLLCQLGLGAVGWGLATWLPDWKQRFVSPSRKSEVCEEQALQEFARFELGHTRERTGVLIFVSLLEHRVVVLADSGIHERVGEGFWRGVDEAVLTGIRQGDLADGLVRGIHRAGEALESEFPVAADDENEIPDRVVVRRE